jgi:hypothetical protein
MVGGVLTGIGELGDRGSNQVLWLWHQHLVQILSSAVAEELGQCHADVFGDLAEQGRSDIAAFVHGNRGAASAGITELLVGATLTDDLVAQLSEDICHL